MSTMKSVIAKFRKELRTTYQAQKNIMDVTDKYLNQLENAEAGGGSEVSVTQIQSTGTKIATVTVDGTPTDLYAPKASVTQTVASGTEIAKVDGTSIYIPDAGSVSVTADGVKTYSALFDELYALVDKTKLKHTSSIFTSFYGSLYAVTDTLIRFTASTANASNIYVGTLDLLASGSKFYSSTGTSVSDVSSSVPTSGMKLEVFY